MADNVLITGGTSGIGLATAIHFASRGYPVVTCGRNLDRIDSTQQKLSTVANQYAAATGNKSAQTLVLQCDLMEKQQSLEMLAAASKALGTIDLLVNNAATAPLNSFAETTAEEFEDVIGINLRASWTLAQQVWKPMVAQNNGVIVNLSSMAAVDPFTGFSLYGASKAWAETWTKALADEGIGQGIRVYGVRPGAVETPMLRSLFPDYPAEQCVSPETVAATIFDLAIHQTQPPGSIVTVAAA